MDEIRSPEEEGSVPSGGFRRLWVGEGAQSSELVVYIGQTDLHCFGPFGKGARAVRQLVRELRKIAADFDASAEVAAERLKARREALPFADFARVDLRDKWPDSSFRVHVAHGGRLKTVLRLAMPPEDASELVKTLHSNVFPDATLQKRRMSPLRAVLVPLLGAAGVLALGTFCFLYAVNAIGIEARPTAGGIVATAARAIGPIPTVLIFGVLLLICLALVKMRLSDPPELATLEVRH